MARIGPVLWIQWPCDADSAYFKKMKEKEWVFEFLARLYKELDEVHGQILGKDPFTSIQDVFAKVWREESCISDMIGGSSSTTITKNSTPASAATEAANATG